MGDKKAFFMRVEQELAGFVCADKEQLCGLE
jgi:hypothetical protein